MDITGAKLQFKETRTVDVVTDKTFEQLLLGETLIKRMKKAGYMQPTPVQAIAIPTGLLGNDMLVQAKSGTGKTLVFAILAASCVTEDKARDKPQVVILAPTHEIAKQIKDTIDEVAFADPHVCLFIGGTKLRTDMESVSRGCDVAVGTPGKIAQLTAQKVLDLSATKLFVLDEADKLMEQCFEEHIKTIYRCVNAQTTQIAVFSATYPLLMDEMLCEFMKSPILVKLSQDVQLIGIHQYVVIALGQNPVEIIDKLLKKIDHKQAVVFSNNVNICQKVCNKLVKLNHKAEQISRDLTSEERTKVLRNLKKNYLKVLVSTDLTARGVDAPNVSVVINIGSPTSCETYFHRIGRAGRFGGNGVGITVLSGKTSLLQFNKLAKTGEFKVKLLSMGNIPNDLVTNQQFFNNGNKFDSEIVLESLKFFDQRKERLYDDTELLPETTEAPISLDIFAKNKSTEKTVIPNINKNEKTISKNVKHVIEKFDKETSDGYIVSSEQLKQRIFGKSTNLFQSTNSLFQKKNSVLNNENNTKESNNETSINAEKSLETEVDHLGDKLATMKMQSFGKSTVFGPKPSIFQKASTSSKCANESDTKIKKYTKSEMIKIRDSRSSKEWENYAKSCTCWDISDEPFEFDPELRCSFDMKIRILREREKAKFRKEVWERKQREERQALEHFPGILAPIFERAKEDPSYMKKFLEQVENRTKLKQKTFEDKSCQAEILIMPTENVEIQTEDISDGETDIENIDKISENEGCDDFQDDEEDNHPFTNYANLLLSGISH